MKLRWGVFAFALSLPGCSGDERGSAAPPASAPAPAPTPAPAPAPTPPASPTPSPTPPPTAGYLRFDELVGIRAFQSACTGASLPGQPPAVTAPTAFGRGLTFMSIPTPQIRTVTGDGLTLTFGPIDVDATAPPGVIAYARTVADEMQRFSISRPGPGGTGLDYARFAVVSLGRAEGTRLYQCIIGVPTLTSDLPAAAIAYPRIAIGATAHVRDTATTPAYSTERSTIAFSADFAARRVTVTGTLIGTPIGAAGPDIVLATIAGTGAIDPSTGGFTADLTSGDRALSGSVSGRFFGPQATEMAMAFSASGPGTGQRSAFSISGGAFGAR